MLPREQHVEEGRGPHTDGKGCKEDVREHPSQKPIAQVPEIACQDMVNTRSQCGSVPVSARDGGTHEPTATKPLGTASAR
jgi:hypothetical protein